MCCVAKCRTVTARFDPSECGQRPLCAGGMRRLFVAFAKRDSDREREKGRKEKEEGCSGLITFSALPSWLLRPG